MEHLNLIEGKLGLRMIICSLMRSNGMNTQTTLSLRVIAFKRRFEGPGGLGVGFPGNLGENTTPRPVNLC